MRISGAILETVANQAEMSLTFIGSLAFWYVWCGRRSTRRVCCEPL